VILRSSRTALSTDSAKEEEKSGERAGGRDGYLLGVFALASLSMFGFYFVDYVYLAAVEAKYPSEASLAAFFGFYKAAVGIVTLVFGTLLTGRLLNRYGLLLGLAALPAVVVAGMLALALAR
jgi:ATP/ADP translocase